VDKIRLTGGEPTLRPDLVDLTGRLAALPGMRAVGLTSNGLTLGRKLPQLRDAGERVASTCWHVPCASVLGALGQNAC